MKPLPAARRRMPVKTIVVLLLAVLAAGAGAQQAVQLQKAVATEAETVYLNPDTASSRVGQVRPGMEVGIQGTSGDFVQVFLGVSGWMRNRGLARYDDPQAPEVIFGAAAQLENAAATRDDDRQAAMDAARLYFSIYNDFPASARAAEGLYRGADIQWQVKMGEEPERRTPSERQFPDDSGLRRVISKFPDTPFAARAAYSLLVEHFTCGDWNEKPECVEKEVHTYQGYVKKYPRGPMAAEAAFDALYRQAIAWTLYNATGPQHNAGKAESYKRDVATSAAALQQNYRGTDWAARGAFVAFRVAQGTPLAVPAKTPLGGP
ncbi:MAG: hypothetical protein ACRD2D_03780, partial [Terriglobales bacterium]